MDNQSVQAHVLDRITDGVAVLDPDLRYTYVDDRGERILGRTRTELLGTRLGKVHLEMVGTTVKKQIEEALKEQRRHSFERHNSDLGRWFQVDVYPDAEGLVLCFSEVTERKEAEREPERIERQSSALLKNTSEAIYIKDRGGTYQFVSEAAAEIFGVGAEEAVGKRAEELFDPERAADIGSIDEHILERGDADTREVVQCVNGERHVFLEHRYPYPDEEGTIHGIVGILRAGSGQERRERGFRKLTEEHDLILKHTEDSIVLVDVEKERETLNFTYERLQSFSNAPLSFEPGYAQGKTPREVFGDELGPKIEANYRRCVEARGPISYEQEVSYPGGHLIWQAKFAPVTVDGEITRLVGIARNVTERIRQEQELRRKNERLDEFAGVVSHDLRNPLNIALGRTTLAREALDQEGVVSEHLEKVETALDRMESIIMDTLILARRGETVSETEPIPIAELLGRCWEMVDTGQISLEIEDAFVLQGDPERLRHVCENLFRNAMQHGNDVETVRVGRAGMDTVYVEDDGPGIPEDEREKVFEPGHTCSEEGTGFGLTIVKRIAEAHGWEVRVADSREGGSRFEFAGVEIVGDK